LIGGSIVGTAIIGDRAGFTADSETNSQSPNKYHSVDVSIPFDDSALTCAVVDSDGNREVNSVRTASGESVMLTTIINIITD